MKIYKLIIAIAALTCAHAANAQTYSVRWSDLIGVTESGGILTKTASASWTNSGATSSNYLASNTDGSITFTITTQIQVQIGFVTNNFSSLASSALANGMGVGGDGTIYTYEDAGGSTHGTYTSGDVFKVSREGSQVKYYRNGTVIKTVSVNAALQLWVRANIYSTAQTSPAVSATFDAKVLIRPVITGTSTASNTGSISLTVEGGRSPYTYSWSSGETTSSISSKAYGNYTVTVTDADGRTAASNLSIGYKVGYTTLYNATESGGILTKTGGAAWAAGADASNRTFTDAWLEFVVTDYTSSVMIGIGSGTDLNVNSFRNGIMLHSDHKFYVYESTLSFAQEAYRIGDVFRISRESGNIKYYKNGVVFRTVTASANTTFIPKTSIGAGVSPRVTCSVDARVGASADVKGTSKNDGTGSISLTPYGGVGPYTYAWTWSGGSATTSSISSKNRGAYTVIITDAEGRTINKTYSIGYDVVYSDLVNATASNGILTKTTVGWDGGGNTSNILANGVANGWVEWVVPQSATPNFMVGVVSNGANWTTTEMRPSLAYLATSNAPSIIAYDGGGQYAVGVGEPGDIMRIERSGGTLYYKLNGTTLRSVVMGNVEWRIKVSVQTGSSPRITSSFDASLMVKGTVTGTGNANNTSGVAATVTGGKAPYTYSWSSGETTSSISGKARGTYTLTVTDADGRTGSRTYTTGYYTSWTNAVNVTQGAGNSLTKTSAPGWNSGALSTNFIPANTDGWLEFVVDNPNSYYAVGFSWKDKEIDHNTGAIRHGIYLNDNGQVLAYLNGVAYSAGSWLPGDVFRVARVGGNIVLTRNGTTLFTSAQPAGMELKPRVSIGVGASPSIVSSHPAIIVPIAVITGTEKTDGTGAITLTTTGGGTAPYTYAWSSGETTASIVNKNRGSYTLTITDAEGRTGQRTYYIGYKQHYTFITSLISETAGNGLTRSSGAGWLQGANTYNVLPANTDGFVEFVVSDDMQSLFMIGFVNKFSSLDVNEFRNAWSVNGLTATLAAQELSTINTMPAAQPGDILRISRVGSNIIYSRNGVDQRTIATNPAIPLFVTCEVNTVSSPPIVTSFDTTPVVKAIVAGTGYANNTGSISTTVEGGNAPYTYSWSSGETTSGISTKARGAYTLTMTDAQGRQVVRNYNIQYRNYLAENLNSVAVGGSFPGFYQATLQPAGANSSNIIPANTDGWIEWIHQDNLGAYQVGFSSNDYSYISTDFSHSIYFAANGFANYVEGTSSVFLVGIHPGDVYRIGREGSNIKYYRNGTLLRTIAVTADMQLKPKFEAVAGRVPPLIISADTQILPIATVSGTDRNDGTGSITVTPTWGTAPYTYSWSGGAGTASSITNKNRGAYTVTVTDNEGRSIQRTYEIGYKPVLLNVTSATVGANSFTKTGSTMYDGGALGSGYLPANTNGWIEMVVPALSSANIYRTGFSLSDGSYGVSSLRYAFEMNGARRIYAIEGGGGAVFGDILAGDVLRIERSGTSLLYKRNGVTKRTTSVDATLELHWKVAMSAGTTPMVNTSFDSKVVLNPSIVGIDGDNRGSITITTSGGTGSYGYTWAPSVSSTGVAVNIDPGTYAVTVTDGQSRLTTSQYSVGTRPGWTDLVGVSASGQGLSKTTTAGWNAGAVTDGTIASNVDGWLEFAITNNTSSFMAGVTTTLNNYSNTSFRYAISVDAATSSLYTVQDAAAAVYLSSYQIGDVIRIERSGTNIFYKRNGVALRTAATDKTIALRIKAAIYSGSAPSVMTSVTIEQRDEMTITMDNWAYQYKYDSRHRMTAKRVPGADWVYMVYDDRDRLVLFQDGAMRMNRQWQFTKYDDLNRPVMTGRTIANQVMTQQDMQNEVNGFYTGSRPFGETRSTEVYGYSNNTYPAISDILQVWTVTYYDDYNWVNSLPYPTRYQFSPDEYPDVNIVEAPANYATVGLVTGSKVKVMDGGSLYLNSVVYYDDKGRPIQSVSDNYKLGIDRTTNILDFVGRMKNMKTFHSEFDVAWRDNVSFLESGRLLTNASPTPGFPYSNALSTQPLAALTDGYVEATVNSPAGGWKVGLTASNPSDIDYAIYVTNGQLRTFIGSAIGGVDYAAGNAIKAGDLLKLSREGNTMKLYRNGVEIVAARINNVNTAQLYAAASLYVGTVNVSAVSSSFSKSQHNVWREYQYDQAGRLLKTWHTLDTGTKVLLVDNEYNELGQLIDKSLHSVNGGSTNEQSIDYRYNIRGWLTSINGAELDPGAKNDDPAGQTRDLFGMDLIYNGTNDFGATERFNGNIAAMKWSTNSGLGTVKQLGYAFTYDAMNRITAADHWRKNTSWSAATNSAFSEKDYLYDLNGNITQLRRYDNDGKIDDLTYGYGTGSARSNQLLSVSDDLANTNNLRGFADGSTTGPDYTYDKNGNMITDKNKGITTAISYLYPLNLPVSIWRGVNGLSGSVGYIYDATGKKLTQYASYYQSRRLTDYAGEFTYEDDRLQSIQHEEGRIVMSGRELVSFNRGDNDKDITKVNTTVTADAKNLHSGETYLKVLTNANSTSPGVLLSEDVPVVAGEWYLIRAKGYLSTYAASPWLKVRFVQSGGQTTDLYRSTMFPSGAAAESWVEQAVMVPLNTPANSTMSAGVFYDGGTGPTITYYVNDFEVVKLSTVAPEYQYNLKDHLGDVRVTFTSKDETTSVTATVEDENEDLEYAEFIHRDNVRRINTVVYDHTYNTTTPPNGTTYAMRLGGTTNEVVGLARSLSVMPGDKVRPQVWAKYYVAPANPDPQNAFQTLMSMIIGGTAPAGTFVDGAGYATNASTSVPDVILPGKSSESGTWPKAYLNWLVFDKDHNPIISKSGYKRIPQTAIEDGTNTAHALMAPPADILIEEPGYVYIYLSNETGAATEVYFDDFKVEHEKSAVIQSQDYYPFGLTFNGFSRENSTFDAYQYNGMEMQNELDLGWLDFGARMYMPEIGRWGSIDPLAEKMRRHSPYNFAYDNPMRFGDPDGQSPIDKTWSITSSKNNDKLTETASSSTRDVEKINSDSPEYAQALGKLKSVGGNGLSGNASLITTTHTTTVTTIDIQYDDDGNEVQSTTNSVTTTTTSTAVVFHDEFGGEVGSVGLGSDTEEHYGGAEPSSEMQGFRADATGYRAATGNSLTNRDEYAGALASQRQGVAVWGVVNHFVGFDENDIPDVILNPRTITPAKLVTTAVQGGVGAINMSLNRGLKSLEYKSKNDPCDNCTKLYNPPR